MPIATFQTENAECTLNLENFEKRNEPHSLSTSEVINSEKRVYLNA